jgi:hypothetical protein
MDNWDSNKAVKEGKARTRDGRPVLNLRWAELEGKRWLVGETTDFPVVGSIGQGLYTRIWHIGGLWRGCDDLMYYTPLSSKEVAKMWLEYHKRDQVAVIRYAGAKKKPGLKTRKEGT